MLQQIKTVILFDTLKKDFNAKSELKFNLKFIKAAYNRLCYVINLKVYFVIVYRTMFVFITNYTPQKRSLIRLCNFLFMFYKIVQLLKMCTILRKKIISLKNLYNILKFESKNPVILVKSNKISVMQIAILMIFGSSVFHKNFIKKRKTNNLNLNRKNMRIPGHKINLYSLTSNRSITYLQCQYKPYTLSQRSLMRMFNAAAKQSASKTVLSQPIRNYASAHGGRFNFKNNSKDVVKINQSTASNDAADVLKSDVTGKHKISVLAVCNKIDCKNTNCAEGTAQTNPCGVSGEYHQEPIATMFNLQQYRIVYELNGAITHKIPQGFEGTEICKKDILGNNVPQYIIREKGVTPVNPQDLKEDSRTTNYLQSTDVTGKLINNASPDSVMSTLNKSPSILLAKNDTPKDENF